MTGRFEILIEDHDGWIRAYLGRGEPAGETARFLSESLTQWFRDRPHLGLHCIVPISRDGDTAELHAWYFHLPTDIPPVSGRRQPPASV